MFGSGANAYRKVGVETEVLSADPHRLVLILFDGALQAMQQAERALAQRQVAEKCRYLSKACQIVDEGLKAAVDPKPDAQLAARLVSLYNYILMRLLQANLRNDTAALKEAARLLGDLRGAWASIAPVVPAVPVGRADVAAAESAERRVPARVQAAYQF